MVQTAKMAHSRPRFQPRLVLDEHRHMRPPGARQRQLSHQNLIASLQGEVFEKEQIVQFAVDVQKRAESRAPVGGISRLMKFDLSESPHLVGHNKSSQTAFLWVNRLYGSSYLVACSLITPSSSWLIMGEMMFSIREKQAINAGVFAKVLVQP